MKSMNIGMIRQKTFFVFFVILLSLNFICAQSGTDTLRGRNLYRPNSEKHQNTDLMRESSDTLKGVNQDSINARLQFIRDSISVRLQFIQDSILAREKFVRDSIQRRKEILDSLTFLKNELPPLLEASLKTFSEDVIVTNNTIKIVGDSILSDYTSLILPFTIDQPYAPWKSVMNLSDKPIKLSIDTIKNKIMAIKAPGLSCSFAYNTRNTILIISSKSSIVSKSSGKQYKIPIDSVWFDHRRKAIKIKRYFEFYQATGQYQKGAYLFTHLTQVKQFEYDATGHLTRYQITNFCDREKAQDKRKVCTNMTFTIQRPGNSYMLTRTTDPANDFADGKFTYEFDSDNNLKSVSFVNNKNSENWKTIVEVNESGYVSRYVYQNKGIVRKTLLVNYYPEKTRQKVETITCLFEDDGVSYYQVNNTTGKTRERNRLTMEWSPWR